MADPEMEELLQELINGKPGKQVEYCKRWGMLRSSRDVWKDDDDDYSVMHNIDGTVTRFTLKGIEEVFRGQREDWDGDHPDQWDNEDDEKGDTDAD